MSLISQPSDPSDPSAPSAPPLDDYNPFNAVEAMPVNGLQQELDFIKGKLVELHGVVKKHDDFLVNIEKRVEQLERIVDRHSREIYAGQGIENDLTRMDKRKEQQIEALATEIQRIKAMLQEVKATSSKQKKSWLRF